MKGNMKRIPLSRDYQPLLQTSYLQDCQPVTQVLLRHDVQEWCEGSLRDEWTVIHDLQSQRTFIEFADDAEAVLFKTWWM